MEFDKQNAIGFLFGFFVLGSFLKGIIYNNPLMLFWVCEGLFLTIIIGFIFGWLNKKIRRKNGNKTNK